jgi:5-formaminoimidazole-4-carboxamide-1-(beta)-D-ribofuranosyl 5'-monophosphate synthetase
LTKKSEKKRYSICTLGSHCSLQILKGAKDEGFNTLLICQKKRLSLYKRFNFIDDMIVVDKFNEISHESVQQHLRNTNSIIIPHGTMIAYMSRQEIEKISTPFFGNKWIIKWEADRKLKEKLMNEALLAIPKHIESKEKIEKLSIVKLHGAAGGRGYFLAWNRQSFEEGAKKLIEQGVVRSEGDLYIQEYVNGVPAYLQFFYSPVTKVLEFMGVDRRYESDADGIGRIPAKQQLGIDKHP